MVNGHQIDPLSILFDTIQEQGRELRGLTHAAGRIEANLDDGRRVHQWLITKQDEHSRTLAHLWSRVTALENRGPSEKRSERIKEWIALGKTFWHLAVLAVVTGARIAQWLLEHWPSWSVH